jgi:hypothetical protein
MILDVSSVCGKIDADLVTFVHNFITLIKIGVPIVLVILGMLDLGKGVVAGKEDEIKKGQSTFVKRLLAGTVVFFMVTISQIVTSIADKDSDGDIWTCANGILNGYSNYVEKMDDIEYYDDETEKQKPTKERKCIDNSSQTEYERCLTYQSQKVCDSIFQNVCPSGSYGNNSNILWETNKTDQTFIRSMLDGYDCGDSDMYYQALYSCSMGQTMWGQDTCIKLLYPFCKTKASKDDKMAECCNQAGGIVRYDSTGTPTCKGYDDTTHAGKNQGKTTRVEPNMDTYNSCMAN